MTKASPADMRKALEASDAYKRAGILFVPMPVFSDQERELYQKKAAERLEQAIEVMEGMA